MFRGAGRPLDEAAAKMRASGIDALAAPVGERVRPVAPEQRRRSEEHTSELQSLMRISYAVFCLKKKTYKTYNHIHCSTICRPNPYHETTPRAHTPTNKD